MKTSVVLLAALLSLASCGSGGSIADPGADAAPTTNEPASTEAPATSATSDPASDPADAGGAEELFPDVVDAEAIPDGDGTWTFNVTLSSPYDSPDRYADSWRIRNEDGTVYGERFLTHDHAGEQPFTRSESGIEIPSDITTVVVEGRDQVSGWGGATLTVALDRS